MATTVKTFVWASTLESFGTGFTGLGVFGGGHDASNGNSAGSIYVFARGRRDEVYGTFTLTTDWEGLGVPAGATVQSVQCTGVDTYYGLTDDNVPTTFGAIAVTVGGSTVFSRGTAGTADGSWQAGSGSSQAKSDEASTTSADVIITMDGIAGNNASAAVGVHMDNLALTIIYTAAETTETGSFTTDAVREAPSGTKGFTAEAWKRQPGGSYTADAVVFATISAATTVDAITFETTEDSFTAEAEKTLGGDFTLDASILSTVTGQVFTGGAPITVGSVAGNSSYATNPSWTHTPTADDKALVVMIGSYEGVATAVTYGNKPLASRAVLPGTSLLNNMEIWSLEDLSDRDDDVVRVTMANVVSVSLMLRTSDAVEFLGWQYSGQEYRDNGVVMEHTYANEGYPFTSFFGAMYDRYYYNFLVILASAITPHDTPVLRGSKGGSNEGFRFYSFEGLDARIRADDSSSGSSMLSVHHKGAGVYDDGIRLDAIIADPYFRVDAIRKDTIYVADTQANGGTTFTVGATFVIDQKTLWLRNFTSSEETLAWLMNGAGNGDPWVSLHDASDIPWYEEHCYPLRDDTTGYITRTVTTIDGPTDGVMFGAPTNNYVFATPGFQGDHEVSGQITVNIWAMESAVGANAALNVAFYRRTPMGGVTYLGKTANTTELGTSAGAVNFNYTPPSAWSFENGDRLMVVPFITDGGGTMAAGSTASLYYNTSTPGGQGDSYVTFTEQIRFMLGEGNGEYYYLNNRPNLDYLAGPNDGIRPHMMINSRDSGVSVQIPTVDGWTDPVPITWPFDGDEPMWFTPPMTVATTVGYKKATFTIYLANDSASGDNVGIAAELALTDKFGSLITVLGYGMCRNVVPTASYDTYYVNFAMRRTEVPVGARFRLRIFIDDIGGGGGSGPMLSGSNAELMIGLVASNWTMSPFPVRWYTTLAFGEAFADPSMTTTYIRGSHFSADAAIVSKSGGFALDALVQKTQTTGIFLIRKEVIGVDAFWMDMSSDASHIVLRNGMYFYVYHGDNWETKTTVDIAAVSGWTGEYANPNVAISSDGSKIVSGDPYFDTGINLDNGEVGIFSGTDWATFEAKTPTVITDYEHFGGKVAISPDDSALAVSIYMPGSITYGKVYAFNGTDWADQRGPWSGSQGDGLGEDFLVFNDDGTQLAMSNEGYAAPVNGVGGGVIRYGTNFASAKYGAPSSPWQEYTLFGSRQRTRPTIDNDYTYGTVYWGRYDDTQKYVPGHWSGADEGIWLERWAGGVAAWTNSWRHANPNNYERLTDGSISSDSTRAYIAQHNLGSPYITTGNQADFRIVLMGAYNVFIAESPWISGFTAYELKIGWDDSSLIAVLLYQSGNSEFRVYKYGQFSFTVGAVIQPGGDFTLDAKIVSASVFGDFTTDAFVKPYFWVDAEIVISGFTANGDFTADAWKEQTLTDVLTVDSIALREQSDSLSVDAFITGFHVDAWIRATITDSLTAEAILGQTVEVTMLTAEAWVSEWYVRHALLTIDAYIKVTKESFYLDAVMSAATFPVRQWFSADAVRSKPGAGSFTAAASVSQRHFSLDAIVGTVEERLGAVEVNAYIDLDHQTRTGFAFVDAHIDSHWSETTFTIDAEVVGTLKVAAFTADADLSAVGEARGTFTTSSVIVSEQDAGILLYAQIEQRLPILLDAWLAGTITLDASIYEGDLSASFTADAAVRAGNTLDAVILGPVAASFEASALVADVAGDYRQFNLDATVQAVVGPRRLELMAVINGALSSFTLDAALSRGLTLDAFVQPYFTVGAYIESTSVVVYPPSQAGEDGTSTDGSTFTSPIGEFGDDLIGSTITIEGVDYTIATIVDDQTVTVSGGGIAIGEGDLSWSVPSGDATDPVGGDPPVTRSFKMLIEWARPGTNQWSDLTADVIWARAEFTQTARVSPGTFTLPLKGAFSQFVGGEDIRLSVDDMVVFGGFVHNVERGYAFEDDYGTPITTLSGTDYNVMLDRYLVYNENWDIQQGGTGKYKNIKPFAEDTTDQTIIRTIANRYMSNPAFDGFDFKTFVDAIESPAPTGKWTMQAGTQIRQVLTEISRITEAVWNIDAYKNLQYHDRGVVNAPYPITDGDGGIACRGLKIRSRVDVMANDVFVWGTEAYADASDAEIIYRRETADRDWDVEYWTYRLARTNEQIAKIKAIPYSKRSWKQKTRLAALKKRRVVEQNKLAAAQSNPSEDGSVETFGRWQHAEFRQDLLKQWAVDRRALAIMNRYSQPPVIAEATVFDPGYQAGQVVEVVSVKHGVAEELAIRQMKIDFAVIKEPVSGEYFAVPRYRLTMGLSPEDPWDIYQYMPFPDIDIDGGTGYNPPKRVGDEDGTPEGGDAKGIIDNFERFYSSGSDFGPATNERTEYRPWSGIRDEFLRFSVDSAVGHLLAYPADGIVEASSPTFPNSFLPVEDLPVTGDTAERVVSAYRPISGELESVPLTENSLSLDEPTRLETNELEWKVRFPTTFEGRVLGDIEQHEYSLTADGYTFLSPGQAASGWHVGKETAEIHADCDGAYWRLECQGYGRVLFTNGTQEELVDLVAGQWYNVVMVFGDVVRYSLYSGEDMLATIVGTAAGSPHDITIGGTLAAATEYAGMSLQWEEITAELGLVATYQTIDDFSEDSVGYVIFESPTPYIPQQAPWPLTNGDWPDATYNSTWFNTTGWLRDNTEPTPDVYHDSDSYTYNGEMYLRGSWSTSNGWPAFPYNFAFYGLPSDHPDAADYNDWVTDADAPWNREGVVRIVFRYSDWYKAASARTNTVEEEGTDNQVRTGIRVYHGLMPNGDQPGQMGEIALILPNPKTETVVADDWGEGPYLNNAPILALRAPGVDTWDYDDAQINYQIFEADTRAVYVYRDLWGDSSAEFVFEASFVDGALRARLYALGEEPPDWMVEYDAMGAYVQEPKLSIDTNHLRVRYTVHNAENMWVSYMGFSATGRPELDILAGEADVEPGWNTEVTPVTNGQFVISATPNPGSVNVFNPDGEILTYGSEWDEADDTGITYECNVDVASVTVTYFVDAPELGQHVPVPRASEGTEQENQPRGTSTGLT